jgi:3-oxoacyl-[acyl-carrier protein] reductase
MTTSASQFEGKWAVVTGSTEGIGRAIALELAAAGANVIIHGRNAARASEVVAAIRSLKREAASIVTAFGQNADWASFVEQCWTGHPIDVWINNAGADVLTGNAAGGSFSEKLLQVWNVDVRGTIELSRLTGQRMLARGQGAIVNIGWDQAAHGMAGDSGQMFAASKGAIMAFTKSLAKSLAPAVRVNCVAPGWIRTKWGQTASPEWQARAQGESLLARWGEPEDVARAVRWLASPDAAFVNGQIVEVNGGRNDAQDRGAHDRGQHRDTSTWSP